jgi:hypothetical protein
LADHLVQLDMLPADFTADWAAVTLAERRCETTTGIAVTPHDTFQAAVAGLVRTVIANRRGQPIQASTKQRLFRGASRQVVISQGPRCPHRGCRIRAATSHADHTQPHSHGGPTTLTNGGIACPRHNTARYQHGYTTRRDTHGWHTYRPDGTEIGFQPPNTHPNNSESEAAPDRHFEDTPRRFAVRHSGGEPSNPIVQFIDGHRSVDHVAQLIESGERVHDRGLILVVDVDWTDWRHVRICDVAASHERRPPLGLLS